MRALKPVNWCSNSLVLELPSVNEAAFEAKASDPSPVVSARRRTLGSTPPILGPIPVPLRSVFRHGPKALAPTGARGLGQGLGPGAC